MNCVNGMAFCRLPVIRLLKLIPIRLPLVATLMRSGSPYAAIMVDFMLPRLCDRWRAAAALRDHAAEQTDDRRQRSAQILVDHGGEVIVVIARQQGDEGRGVRDGRPAGLHLQARATRARVGPAIM